MTATQTNRMLSLPCFVLALSIRHSGHAHNSQTQRLSLPTLNCNSSHAGREEHAAGFCLSSIILSPLNGYVKMSPVRQGTLALSQKELQRVAVITSCVKGDLACARAASLLNLTACQTT